MSRLTLHADLSEEFINRRLDEEVPKTLAQEKGREVGAPGRASYVVSRGHAKLHQDQDSVYLTIPIESDISVCKPFGSNCFRYGSCHPKFHVSLKMATNWGERFSLAAPLLSSKTKEGCRIAVDVTPQLESIVRTELGKAQAELRSRWPNTERYAQELAQHQSDPVFLWDGTCAQWKDINIALEPLEVAATKSRSGQTARRLRAAVQIDGLFSVADRCTALEGVEETELPNPQSVSKIPKGSTLHFPERLGLDQLKTSLSHAIANSSTFREAQLDRVSTAKDKRIYFSVHVQDAFCGLVWLSAKLAPSEDGSHLRLLEARPESSYPAALLKQLASLIQRVTSEFKVSLQGGPWLKKSEHEGVLESLLAPLQDNLAAQSLRLKIEKLDRNPPLVKLGPEEVHLFYPVSGRLKLAAADH